MNQIPYKYIALGIIVGYLIPYIYTLTQTEKEGVFTSELSQSK